MNEWIAIVDDDAANLTVASHILYKKKMKVSCLRSGSELLVFLEHNRPDLILLDIHMPGMDGFETMEKISANERYGDVPVIFLTGDEDAETETKALIAGAVDFITKPFVPEVMLVRIRHIIELSRLQNHLADEVERKTQEIMEQHEQIRTLSIAAETDQMTGLLNKSSAQETISKLCKNSQGIFMMIDLDSFKLVNDIYGHNAGDRILIRFAEIIRSALRTKDIVGRFGGDEFVAFCEHINDEDVINEKARYINDEIYAYAREFLGEDMNIPLGASVGAVSCPDEGRDFLTLYKKADEALYSIKQNGKHGCAFYWESRRPQSEVKVTGSSNAMMILNERKQSNEAMVLPFEQFRMIFQLLMRLNRNYSIRSTFLLFTIVVKDGMQEVAEMVDDFCKLATGSLRSSDVITKSSTNQCMALVLYVDAHYGEKVASRVIKNWHLNGKGNGCHVEYEIEQI